MGEQEQTKLDEVSFNFDKNICQYLFGKYITINSDKKYIYELQYFKDEIDYLYEIDEKGTKELLVYLLKNVYDVLKFNQRKDSLSIEECTFLEELDQVSNFDDAFAVAFFENEDLFLLQILKYFSLPVSDIVNSKNNAHNTKAKTVVARFNNPLNIFSNFIYAKDDLIFSKEYNKEEYKNIYLKFLEKYKESKEIALNKCRDTANELKEYQDSEEKVLERYFGVIKGLSIYNKTSYDKLIIDMCKEYILKNTVKSNNAYKDTLRDIIIKYSCEGIIELLSKNENEVFLKLLLEDYNLENDDKSEKIISFDKSKQRVVNKLLLHHNRSLKELVKGNSNPKVVDIECSKKHIGQAIIDRFVKLDKDNSVIMKSESFCQFMIDLYNEDTVLYDTVFGSIINDVYKSLKWDCLFDKLDEKEEELLDLIEEADDINDLYNYILENYGYARTLLYTMDVYYTTNNLGNEISLENYFNQVDLNPIITSVDTLGLITKLDYANKGFLFSKNYVKQEYIDLYASLFKKMSIDNDNLYEIDGEIDVVPYYYYILESLKYSNKQSYYQLITDMYIEYYCQVKLMNEDEKDEFERHLVTLIEKLSFEQLIEQLTYNDNLLVDMVNRYSKYNEYSSYQRSLIKPNLINKTAENTLRKLYKAKKEIKRES